MELKKYLKYIKSIDDTVEYLYKKPFDFTIDVIDLYKIFCNYGDKLLYTKLLKLRIGNFHYRDFAYLCYGGLGGIQVTYKKIPYDSENGMSYDEYANRRNGSSTRRINRHIHTIMEQPNTVHFIDDSFLTKDGWTTNRQADDEICKRVKKRIKTEFMDMYGEIDGFTPDIFNMFTFTPTTVLFNYKVECDAKPVKIDLINIESQGVFKDTFNCKTSDDTFSIETGDINNMLI